MDKKRNNSLEPQTDHINRVDETSTVPPKYTAQKPKLFTCDAIDFAFALVWSALGFAYVSLFFSQDPFIFTAAQTYGKPPVDFILFVLCYVVASTAYFLWKKISIPKAPYFWGGALIVCTIPLFFYRNGSTICTFQILFAHFVALYFPAIACGKLVRKRTSGFLPFDILLCCFVYPFWYFFAHVRVIISSCARRFSKQVVYVIVGILCAIPLLVMVTPWLAMADRTFEILLSDSLRFVADHFGETLFKFFFSLPVVAFLFGNVFGCVSDSDIFIIKEHDADAFAKRAHCVPSATIFTVIGLLCALYTLFTLLQLQYVFGGFFGYLPNAMTYAQYARSGFYELCAVGILNLAVFSIMELCCIKTRAQSKQVLWCGRILCVLSLLLNVTAFAKLLLYMSAYGLTIRRVIAFFVLIWFCAVFVFLLWRGVRSICAVQAGIVCAVVLFACLCVLPVQFITNSYNETRIANGTLQADALEKDYEIFEVPTLS